MPGIAKRIGHPIDPRAVNATGMQLSHFDPKANSAVTVHDGASRPIQVQQHLREKGQGDAPPEPNQTFLAYGGASITTSTLYDGNGRVRQLVDDNGNITHWTYDSLNRQTVMTFHDGSTRTSVYNQASDVIEYTDENGSEFTNTFDAAGRKKNRTHRIIA